MPTEAERKIADIVDGFEAKGRVIPRVVGKLPDFPYTTFDALTQAFKQGAVLLQRFKYEINIELFETFATSFERFWFNAYTPSLAVIPLGAIALGYFVSWWFLLLVVLVPLSMKWTKNLYNRVIFRAAFGSELIFCFLYYIGTVNVCKADGSKNYFWNIDTHPHV